MITVRDDTTGEMRAARPGDRIRAAGHYESCLVCGELVPDDGYCETCDSYFCEKHQIYGETIHQFLTHQSLAG